MIVMEEASGPSFDGRCVSIDYEEADCRCPNPCLPDQDKCEECWGQIRETLDWMVRIR